jgi:hypothetical protein
MNDSDVSVSRTTREQLLLAAYSLCQQISDVAARAPPDAQAVLTDTGRLAARLISEVASRDGLAMRPTSL